MTTARNSRILRIIPLMLIIMLLCPFAYGKVIYVDDNVTGANDGTSWIDAYNYLQDALADANNSAKPVEIRVAQGIYKPDQENDVTPGDRETTFQLINGVTLKGGYAGFGEPDPNARDTELYESVLSGDLNGDDPHMEPHMERRRRIIVAEDAAKRVLVPTGPISEDWKSSTVFDDSDWVRGAGGVGYERSSGYETLISLDVVNEMYNRNTTCYIRIPFTVDANDLSDCYFITLNMRYDDGFVAYINGVEVARRNFTHTPSWNSQADEPHVDSSAVVFEPIDIFNQIGTLQEGDNLLAIHAMNVSTTSSDFLISVELVAGLDEYYLQEIGPRLLLTDANRAENSYHVLTASRTDRTATLDGFTICGGNANIYSNIYAAWPSLTAYGGGIYNGGGSPTLLNCKFTHNSAIEYGGGMYNITDDDNCDPILVDCTFSGNWAGYSGGGMRNCGEDRANDVILIGCVFTGNRAGWEGGGMSNFAVEGWCRPTLTNCIFTGNRAQRGGAMANRQSEGHCRPRLVNCTFTGNFASHEEGAIYNNGSESILANCILWNDRPSEISTAAYQFAPTVTHSNVQGSWPGEGNLNAEPLFAVPGYWDPNGTADDTNDDFWVDGDYHLKSQAGRWDPVSESWAIEDFTSPCIDAGDPNNPVAFEPSPNGGVINMGAYGGTVEASKSPSGLHAKYGGGEPNDPYLIYTAEQMNEIGLNEEDWDKHFKLMADIDLSEYDGKDGRLKFNIIGRYFGWDHPDNKAFSGVFDGNGKVIRNFTWSSVNRDTVALFAFLDWNATGPTVKNLGLEEVNIRAENGYEVAALAARSEGKINNCYVTGYVSGRRAVGGLVADAVDGHVVDCYSLAVVEGDQAVGGLVGTTDEDASITRCYSCSIVAGNGLVGGLVGENYRGTITNCYATGSISGNKDVGGLVGVNSGSGLIVDCYARGSVTGTTRVGGLAGGNYVNEDEGPGLIRRCYSSAAVRGEGEHIGGLVGWNEARIISCFWDRQASGMDNMCGEKHYGVGCEDSRGKTTAEMQMASTFLVWGWCNEGVWTIDEGADYPRLWWENMGGETLSERLSDFVTGSGEPNDPYLIYTAEELNMIGLFWCDWDKHFKLMGDIDLAAYTGTAFNIIGDDRIPFTGVFDGNGKKISNFSYASTDTFSVGLFGYVYRGVIKDLGLIDANISGRYAVGSLVGRLSGEGTITNCYCKGGSISGTGSYVGGLVGYNFGTLSDCYATGAVSGGRHVGGLVGENYRGTITNCYATGSISGNKDVGGLVGGSNYGTISNCYATGSVSGNDSVGGLVGALNWEGATITNCYSSATVTGTTDVGGLIGMKSEYGTPTVIYSFWDTDTSGQPTSDGGTGKTTAEMQTESTFTDAGWDFVAESVNGTQDIWWILEGQDYPRLWWETAEP